MMNQLLPGQRYRIRYRIEGQRRDREVVADFLANENGRLIFSGRPLFGTLPLPEGAVLKTTPIWDDTPITAPQQVTR